MSRSTDKSPLVRLLPGVSLAAFVLAGASQLNKQVFAADSTIKQGKKTGRYVQTTIDPARRGSILSADGRALAQQAEAATLGVSFDRIPETSGFFVALSNATGIPATEFESLAAEGVKYREWRKVLTSDQARRLAVVKSEWRADGVSIVRTGAREYPLGEAAASLIGFVRDGKGLAGLESSKDDVISGQNGKTVGITDRQGQFLPMRLDRESEKRLDGKNLVLTIDSALQQEAALSIARAVREFNADHGVAIVMDPKSGAILAMANAPSFDPSNPTVEKGKDNTIGVNPATMYSWEPGSTFKILTLAKALDEGVTHVEDRISCGGSLQVWSNRVIRCDAHGGSRAHGSIDGTVAIAKSCNVSAATWAKRIGYDKMVGFLDDLKLLERTHLGLPKETTGQFNRDEYAKGLQLATVGFGQSLTTTPVALATAFCAIANDGVRPEPRLIESVGGIVEPRKGGSRVLKSQTCQEVLRTMRAVIESDAGTGKTLRIPGYELGGKTGTAQKINKKTGAVEGGGYVSNFVGFVPALDPKVVILVMVDNPKGSRYYGGTVAGPVFVDLAKASIRKFRIPKSSSTSDVAPPKLDRTGPRVDVGATAIPADRSKPSEGGTRATQ